MFYRDGRLRKNETIRTMLWETALHKEELNYPIFVAEGVSGKRVSS